MTEFRSRPNPPATLRAWRVTLRWSWSTNFGALVVPEVVKMTQPAPGAAALSSKDEPEASDSYPTAGLPTTAFGTGARSSE